MDADFETLVKTEWLGINAGIAFSAAEAAYAETERIIRENWVLQYRNEANLRGQLRYFITTALLEICARQGRLDGVTARWEPVGCDILILTSKSFEVQICHTSGPEQKPKWSMRRDLAVISNQRAFDSIMSESKNPNLPQSDLVTLFLLHGNKKLSFMNLVCPDSLDPKAPYIYTSPNFATLPRLVPTEDVEIIHEALPQVAAELIARLKSEAHD